MRRKTSHIPVLTANKLGKTGKGQGEVVHQQRNLSAPYDGLEIHFGNYAIHIYTIKTKHLTTTICTAPSEMGSMLMTMQRLHYVSQLILCTKGIRLRGDSA